MFDLFFEFDAQLSSPSIISVPPQSFDETGMTIASSYPFDETVIAADSNDNDMGEVIVTGPISGGGGGYWFNFGDASGYSPREVSGDGSGTGGPPIYYD